MPAFTPTPPLYTKYRTTLANRIVVGIVLPAVMISIGYALFATWQSPHRIQGIELVVLGGMLLAEFFMLYTLAAVFKSALLITDGHIIEQNAWPLASKELLLQEIAGFRTTDKTTILYPTQPDLPKLSIPKGIEFHDDFQFWLASNYPDLDQVEAEAAQALLLADEQLGDTAEARAARLALAKQVSTALNVVGGVVSAWLFIRPQPYFYAIVVGVMIPLLAAGALFFFPKLMRLESSKNSPHASIAGALLLPSIGLAIRSVAYNEPIAYTTVWPVAGGVAIAFGLLLLAGSRHSLLDHGTPRRGNEWGVLLMCAAVYGYGATLTSNAAFDAHAPTLYRAQVLSKREVKGKSTSYYLQLSTWGPRSLPEEVLVSSSYYQREQPGDSVTIVTRPGRLGIAWFRVVEVQR